ncbi:MAG: glycosyltransferase, partial [Thermoplasmatota archaeon]
MVEDYPKVSFLIPVLNEEKTLAQSLDSLLVVEYPAEKMEILLAIGNCTDNTRMIAEQYAKKYTNIRILENPTGNTSIGR